jgi:SAM-dependent methyltransferase
MSRAAPGDALEFTGERFTPESVREIYYEHFHRYAWALQMVDGLDVLDCACGEGYGAHLLAGRARSVVGADVDARSVEHAQQRYAQPGLEFVEADALKLPFEDRRFDAVVSFETLEHLSPHDELMTEFRRVLKPGGFLVMSSPDRKTYSDDTGFENEFHVRELYRDELEALLGRHFPNFRLYAQKLMFHSALWRMDDDARAVQHLRAGSDGAIEEGVRPASEPLYFITLSAAENVSLPEPAALSPDAVLEVALFDMSRPNPTQRPVAKSIYGDLGEGPIVFAFDYDPTVIDRDHAYVLVARILENGRAVFLTRDQKRVLTQGAGDTVRLDLVRRPGA